jgi:hypothetical protein
MTDSISVKLDISHIPQEALAGLPTPLVYRQDPKRQSSILPFPARQSWRSPLTRKPMKIKVLVNRVFTPVALVADFNIPNATVGQNAELGHSIYAACSVALDFFKIFLAEHGTPLAYLERLTISNIQLGSATITYLVPASENRPAQDIIEVIAQRFTLFFPLSVDYRYGGSVVGSQSSKTAYCKRRGWAIRVYSTHADKIPSDENPLIHQERIEFAANMVRMELILTAEELRKLNLHSVAAWREGHANGIYKKLFDEYIRNKGLRLDERLRQDKPDSTDLQKLSSANRHIVEGYLEGKQLKNCKHLMRESKLDAQKVKSSARLKILENLRIDIDIAWAEHRKLGSRWMDKVIVYPGDHHPPDHRVSGAFCRENLTPIKLQLRATLVRMPVHSS